MGVYREYFHLGKLNMANICFEVDPKFCKIVNNRKCPYAAGYYCSRYGKKLDKDISNKALRCKKCIELLKKGEG